MDRRAVRLLWQPVGIGFAFHRRASESEEADWVGFKFEVLRIDAEGEAWRNYLIFKLFWIGSRWRAAATTAF
jgi:hypothetical protein